MTSQSQQRGGLTERQRQALSERVAPMNVSDKPIPEAEDDLHNRVIEIATDVEVLLDGQSVTDVFVASSARKKRVEVTERHMTDADRKLFQQAKELELESWLDHKVFDLVKKQYVDKERIMKARWVLTWKTTGKAKARLCVLEFQDPDLTEGGAP